MLAMPKVNAKSFAAYLKQKARSFIGNKLKMSF